MKTMKTMILKAVVHLAWLFCRWWLGKSTNGAWVIRVNQMVMWPMRLLLKESVDPSRMVCEFRWMLVGLRYNLWWKAEPWR